MTGHPLLDGVTVLEIGHSVAAPFAGFALSELGAVVLKLEAPDGDPARYWGDVVGEGSAPIFECLNRGKRSIVADLSNADQRDAVLALIDERVDVVLQNLKPGALDRLGLGASALRKRKPALIVASIGAYGRDGPLAAAPGYDPMIQAGCGLMSMMGEDGRPPVRIPVSMIDMSAGLWAAFAVAAALSKTEKSGQGCCIDTSLFEVGLASMAGPIASYAATGEVPLRLGSAYPAVVPSQAFETSDGWLLVAAASEVQFGKLLGALNLEPLAFDPRFRTNPDRLANRAALIPLLSAAFLRFESAEWERRLLAAGIPCSPIRALPEVLRHPQTTAVGMLYEGETGMSLAAPLLIDGVRNTPPTRAPRLGEHSRLLGQPATGARAHA